MLDTAFPYDCSMGFPISEKKKKQGGMGNQRTYLCIAMVFALKERGHFKKSDIMDMFRCSQRTYDRALSDLRCYLMEHLPEQELKYDKKSELFSLV